MALLPYTTVSFPNPTPPPHGNLPVPLSHLIRAAITVGASPLALGSPPRPQLETKWRGALIEANLQEDALGQRWTRTDACERLDRSEKSAVSYFLGMTQAKLTCEMLLGVPHLVHLDTFMALRGLRLGQSRPDFVGFDLASMTCSVGVEAKGRAKWQRKAVTKAKQQAQKLPVVLSTTSSLRIASLAYFDRRGHWTAYLEDPPPEHDAEESISKNALLLEYYRPLVSALRAAGDQEPDGNQTSATLPDMDLRLSLPTSIVSVVGEALDSPSSSETQVDDLELDAAVAELPDRTLAQSAPERMAIYERQERQNSAECRGLDGVEVRLDDSWFG